MRASLQVSSTHLTNHSVPLLPGWPGLYVAPLTILHITEVVPGQSTVDTTSGHNRSLLSLISPEVELAADAPEQFYLIAPVVAVRSGAALGGLVLISQGVVRPGQDSNLKQPVKGLQQASWILIPVKLTLNS